MAAFILTSVCWILWTWWGWGLLLLLFYLCWTSAQCLHRTNTVYIRHWGFSHIVKVWLAIVCWTGCPGIRRLIHWCTFIYKPILSLLPTYVCVFHKGNVGFSALSPQCLDRNWKNKHDQLFIINVILVMSWPRTVSGFWGRVDQTFCCQQNPVLWDECGNRSRGG